MKVASTINTKKPELSTYDEVSIIYTTTSNDRVFVLHRSYNKLLSCYMLSDYKTGTPFTAFGIPPMDLTTNHVDRVVERVHEYLDSINKDDIKQNIGKMPVVNEDDIEVSPDIDYSDVELTKKIKKSKDKELEKKVKNQTATTKKTKKSSDDKKPKRKRGRPPKNKTVTSNSNSEINTLI